MVTPISSTTEIQPFKRDDMRGIVSGPLTFGPRLIKFKGGQIANPQGNLTNEEWAEFQKLSRRYMTSTLPYPPKRLQELNAKRIGMSYKDSSFQIASLPRVLGKVLKNIQKSI